MQPILPRFASLLQELRRGTLVLAVLTALDVQEACGSDLRKALGASALAIEEGALYPMLRRLEEQGLLASDRREEGSRHKRFYRLTAEGALCRAALMAQWDELHRSIHMLSGGHDGHG